MKKIFIVILFINFCFVQPLKSERLLSNVLVLVDFSSSYFHSGKKKKLENTLKEVNKVVLQSVKVLPLNMAIQFLSIKELSLESEVLCQTQFARKTLKGKKVGEGLTKKKQLKLFLNECTKIILNQKEGLATDLTGAIRKAVFMANSQLPKGEPRIVIILSDFKEERGYEIKNESSLSLEDFSFALVYPGKLDQDKNNLNQLSEFKVFAEKLKSKLEKQGAKEVGTYFEDGFFSGNIIDDLL